MTEAVRLVLNGREVAVEADPATPLLSVLRGALGLTGTRFGCGEGACGACSVLINGKRTFSCSTPISEAHGKQITTIEGLATGEALHPVQQAFHDEGAFQCGYCTAGQIVSGVGCIKEGHAGSAAEIREWMSGNICRCGAYTNIVAAIAKTANEA